MTSTPPAAESTIPAVVGINFGNSFASIAVFTKEGLAECIANEDGERQIACAVSFFGEEMYIGNQAKNQLVKNSKNTIVGFRNLLGKKFSEIPQSQATTSAPVIQHPDIPDEPAYKVEVLQPAPSPLPTSNVNTPAASSAPTPRSEPIPTQRILSVSEVTVIFLKSLLQSAQDFLGKPIQGAVITVPSHFTDVQKDALEKAASEAGVKVYQLLEEAAAVASTTTTEAWSPNLSTDRTQLVVDVGASSLHLSLLSLRQGLAHVLASHSQENDPTVGGDAIDSKLITFFANEFTKKTKTPLSVCQPTPASTADARAEAKLRLAVEHTKRTLSASPGAATCSVESLKDGLDFTGSVNRMRFDMLARPIYTSISSSISQLLEKANVDPTQVDEIVYVGGTTCLPGLDEHICLDGGFSEGINTPFTMGTVVGGGIGDPATVLARGCALQAALIESLLSSSSDQEKELLKAFNRTTELSEAKVTSKTLGLLFPDGEERLEGDNLGGTFVPVILKETTLPARRSITFDVQLSDESKRFAFELWEVSEGIRVEKVKPPKVELSDAEEDEEEEEEEEIETKHKTISKETLLGAAEGEAKLGIQAKGGSASANKAGLGKWTSTMEATVVVTEKGAVEVVVKEVGKDGVEIKLSVSAP
ncbi:actin-like ATPase domain-containing protein [Dendrothele bispora CBS 962.96]|uniref:Actin-like ATPase domain-containing protein n=1 Tax=Dendrothele bispora (strain CBS 962.96) TaxID=1314807 RepID=A0A4S8LUX6_DENBC|nr:actin-like ATPase domain-containing protein [Dendrothele bispora CBS 962.96]